MSESNHFALSKNKYITTSIYADDLYVGIYDSATGEALEMSPFLWFSLAKNHHMIYQPSDDGTISIVNGSLMLSTIHNNPWHVLIQYLTRDGNVRESIVLVGLEWPQLRWSCPDICDAVISTRYTHALPHIILEEFKKLEFVAAPTTELEDDDIETILRMTLIKTIADHLHKSIDLLFKCSGCEIDSPHQHHHPCVTYNFEMKLIAFGDFALAHINFANLSKDFFEEIVELQAHVSKDLFDKWNFAAILQCAKDLYKSYELIVL